MIKNLLMNQSLKARIVILYTIFTVAVVGIMTLFAYLFMVDQLKEKESEAITDSISHLEQMIDSRIESINEEFINNFENETFSSLYIQNKYSGNSISNQVAIQNSYKDYFVEAQIRNSDIIHSIQLVGQKGNVYADSYSPVYNYNAFIESPIYSAVMKEKNKIHFLNYDSQAKYFAIARSFYFYTDRSQMSKLPAIGYKSMKDEDYSSLVFFMKKSYLKKLIDIEANKREIGIYVIDNNNQIVVDTGSTSWCDTEQISSLLNENSGEKYYETKLDGHNICVYNRPLSIMNWKLLYVYDLSVLYRQAGEIRKIALIVFAVAMISLIFIASIISNSVVRPIKLLSQTMDDTIENNLEVQINFKYNDEIAKLGRSFSVLMGRIHTLMTEIKEIERQKRAEEMKALQAQINPHFLYNTLDTVYWLAKIDGNDKIAGMVSDLADLFRLSLNKGEDITTVTREIEHVKKYLDLQKIRMDEKFDYEILLDDDAKDCRIPKLILQPFVENSLIHGFENIAYQGKISINATAKNDVLIFEIRDNGKGMTKDKVECINGGEYRTTDSHGYAINNVKERIALYTKEGYGVKFDEEVKEGTSVIITFPKDFIG